MNEITASLARVGLLNPAQREHWKMAWLSTVDHKRIGILYMVAALGFFVLAGVEALLIRLQLAVPNNALLDPDTYNMLFTMHGTTMIFLVAMPVLFGLANYVVPLQIGGRDMAFSRPNTLRFLLAPLRGDSAALQLSCGGRTGGWLVCLYAIEPDAVFFSARSGLLGVGFAGVG